MEVLKDAGEEKASIEFYSTVYHTFIFHTLIVDKPDPKKKSHLHTDEFSLHRSDDLLECFCTETGISPTTKEEYSVCLRNWMDAQEAYVTGKN